MPAAAVTLLLASLGMHEGMRHIPYRDRLAPGAPWTVCRGITGPDVVPGHWYTDAECDAIEHRFVARMAERMGGCLQVPLTLGEWIAWGDFNWNLGTAKWCGSTALRLLNEGHHEAACAQITRWTYTNGKDCRIESNNCSGIVKRRAWERSVCERDL